MSVRSTSLQALGRTVRSAVQPSEIRRRMPGGAVLRWAGVVAGASALAFLGASSAVVATPAALANHDSVKELCGRNYTVNRQHVVIRRNATGRRLGRLVLVKNRRSRTYCAVVILRNHNRKRFARLLLTRTGPNGTCTIGGNDCSTKKDAGRFKRFAGPLAMTKRDRGCIRAQGWIGRGQIGWSLDAGNCS